jgi:hypothetical protein
MEYAFRTTPYRPDTSQHEPADEIASRIIARPGRTEEYLRFSYAAEIPATLQSQ